MVNAGVMSQLDQGRGGSRFGAWDPSLTPRRTVALCSIDVEHTHRGVIGQGRPPDLVNTATVKTEISHGQPRKLTGYNNATATLHNSLT